MVFIRHWHRNEAIFIEIASLLFTFASSQLILEPKLYISSPEKNRHNMENRKTLLTSEATDNLRWILSSKAQWGLCSDRCEPPPHLAVWGVELFPLAPTPTLGTSRFKSGVVPSKLKLIFYLETSHLSQYILQLGGRDSGFSSRSPTVGIEHSHH